MNDVLSKIVKAVAAAGGAIMGLLGGWSPLLTVFAAFMVLDYITGVLVAIMGKSDKSVCGGPSSRVGLAGLMRKGGMVAVVFVAAMLDHALGTGQTTFVMATTAYFIANEGLSILENVGLMGVPVPEIIKKGLELIKDKNGADDEEKEE